MIRATRPGDLPRLREVERAAGRACADAGTGAVAEHEPPPLDVPAGYQRDGPSYAPHDARLGFEVVPDGRLGEGLRRVREHESALGLDPWPRVVMRRAVPAPG